MDRNIVYPGSIPLDTDLLGTNRNTMIALSALIQTVLGTSTVVNGLTVGPTVPASLGVTVGAGSIAQLTCVDATAYGSLGADTTDPLMKMGVNLSPTIFTLSAPTIPGQSIAYLMEATFQESDAAPVVLPYYNAANPAQPYLGPNNTGVAQNTLRTQRVQLQLKAGAPATTGSQALPAVDVGWVGLVAIVVNYGQNAVTAAAITALATAPVLNFTLPQLRPGFSQIQTLTTSGNFAVPAGVSSVKVRVFGGGGGGGGNTTNGGGGGGGGGGYAEGVFAVTPGQVIAVIVGNGGGGGANNSGTVAGNNGGNAGLSSFGAFLSATGGLGGGGSLSGGQGNAGSGGTGSGGVVNMTGGWGNAGFSGVSPGFGGMGGTAAGGGGGGGASTGMPQVGATPGGGGAGGGGNFAGAAGASGVVIVEY
jgi:hypothetical protein